MSKKKLLALVGSVCLVLVLVVPTMAGCTTPTPTLTPTPTSTPSPAEVITWTFFEQVGPGANWATRPEIVEEFNRRIWEGTNHRLQIEWYFQGEHPYTTADMLRPLKAGACDLIETSTMSGGDEPALRTAQVTSYCFLIPGGDFQYAKGLDRWIREEGILDDIYGRWNGKPLINYYLAGQHIYMKDTLLTGPDSLKGKNVRVPDPSYAALIKLMGGNPVTITWGEVYTALATGLAEGLVCSFTAAYGAGYMELTPYVTWTNVCFSCQNLVANKDSLAALPPDVREAFLATLYGLEDWWCDGDPTGVLLDLDRALREIGVVVQALPADWREELRAQSFEKLWKPEIECAGEEGWAIWDKIARKLISDGYDVGGYIPK